MFNIILLYFRCIFKKIFFHLFRTIEALWIYRTNDTLDTLHMRQRKNPTRAYSTVQCTLHETHPHLNQLDNNVDNGNNKYEKNEIIMYGILEKKVHWVQNRNFTILWEILCFVIKVHKTNPYPLKLFFLAYVCVCVCVHSQRMYTCRALYFKYILRLISWKIPFANQTITQKCGASTAQGERHQMCMCGNNSISLNIHISPFVSKQIRIVSEFVCCCFVYIFYIKLDFISP